MEAVGVILIIISLIAFMGCIIFCFIESKK